MQTMLYFYNPFQECVQGTKRIWSEVGSGYHVTTYEQGRDTSTNVMDDAAFQLLPAISTQQHSQLHREGEGRT